jgi:hypothetical protein
MMKRLVIFLIWLLLPFLVLMAIGERGLGISPFFVALILISLFLAADAFLSRDASADEPSAMLDQKTSFSDEEVRVIAQEIQPVFTVKGWKAAGEAVQFEGVLRRSPPDALKRINEAIASFKLQGFLTDVGPLWNARGAALRPAKGRRPVPGRTVRRTRARVER